MAMRFDKDFARATLNEPYCIFDTGAANILVPNYYYKEIMKSIFKVAEANAELDQTEIDWQLKNGVAYVNCAHTQYFRPFELMFDNYFIPIEPDLYFWD